MEWVVVGDVASVVQLTLTLKLIYAIVRAAKNARMHKRNCRQFAQHLKLIANLLQQLKPQDVDEYAEYRETREPLDHLEQCLKKALVLVENCRDKSYLYLIAMGWSIVGQFKDYQAEIDRYLRLIPLITLVENHREKLRAIERDRREYTLDEEEKKIYSTLLKDDRTTDDAAVLQKSLSRSYPGFGLDRALREENQKLCAELQRNQQQMDLDQCDVIEHLLEITKTVNMSAEEREKLNRPTHSRASTMDSLDSGMSAITAPPGRPAPNSTALPKITHGPNTPHVPIGNAVVPVPHVPTGNSVPHYPFGPHVPTGNTLAHSPFAPQVPTGNTLAHSPFAPHVPTGNNFPHSPFAPHVPTGNNFPHSPFAPHVPTGNNFPHSPFAPHVPTGNNFPHSPFAPHVPIGNAGITRGADHGPREPQRWHNSLYDCCMDPFLCISTFLYPCGTFTNIAAVVTDGEYTQELACHDLAFHSLYLGCCIFTCCFRRKLRKRFNIPGGTCDDCWAHILCCCCALVQEWREIQACEEEGLRLYKMRVPSQQTMENYRPRPNPNNQERYAG